MRGAGFSPLHRPHSPAAPKSPARRGLVSRSGVNAARPASGTASFNHASVRKAMTSGFKSLKKSALVQRLVCFWRQRARDFCFGVLRVVSPRWMNHGPVKGMFSAYAELCNNKLKGEVVLAGQETLTARAGSLRKLARLEQDKHQPWPIFWTCHEQARLIGPTALLVDGRKLACQEAMFNYHFRGDLGFYKIRWSKPVQLEGEWTSILSCWGLSGNYYHWMLDNLPRLALLNRLPAKTRIIVQPTLKPFQIDSLRMLGVEDKVRPLREQHLLVERFFFSAPTAMTGCPNPYAVRFLRERLLPHADANGPTYEKIFIRRQGRTRGILNEAEVMAFVQERGWAIVDPESLSLAQQINLFQNARAVCGAHGAGFTNLLWCKPAVVAIELLADNYLNGCYESLADCVSANHRFLVMPGDPDQRSVIDLKQLAALLPK